MNSFDKFINTYKELEKELREENLDVKEYEGQLDEVNGDKLRMCRNFRNYIQHSKGYEKFLAITPDMQKFLENLLDEYKMRGDVVKKHIIKISNISCGLNDKQGDCLEKIAKNGKDFLVVIEKDEILGLVSVYDLLKLKKTDKVKAVKKLSKNFCEISHDTKINLVDKEIVNIVKEKGKIIGVVK